jgi:hypothetical protein
MQPLKSLTFVRVGSANSHKYKVSKKNLRSLNSTIKAINHSWFCLGITTNFIDWHENVNCLDITQQQEDLIDHWRDLNREIYIKFLQQYRYCKFNKDSFHSPPQVRGLYAFPQYRLEPFLTHWDNTKLTVKHYKPNTDKESYVLRVKKYITIKYYNKPSLWCHFIHEAVELKVDIRTNKSWVLINSCDYLKVLALHEKNRLKEHRIEFENRLGNIKHCYQYGSKDEFEVFLVGI